MKKKISTKNFDKAFDTGFEVIEHLDTKKAKRINTDLKRVNIDFPTWIINKLDQEATRLGISRQALVKMWIAERFDKAKA